MVKDAKIQEKDVPVEVFDNDKIIAEGIIDSSAVHIGFVLASMAALLTAILVLSHVRFGVFASLCLQSVIIAAIGQFIGFGAKNEKIQVTETSVLVKNIFGKEMYLCTDSITAVGVSAFNTVHVLSDSCKISCMFVKNSREIVAEIRKLIEDKTEI